MAESKENAARAAKLATSLRLSAQIARWFSGVSFEFWRTTLHELRQTRRYHVASRLHARTVWSLLSSMCCLSCNSPPWLFECIDTEVYDSLSLAFFLALSRPLATRFLCFSWQGFDLGKVLRPGICSICVICVTICCVCFQICIHPTVFRIHTHLRCFLSISLCRPGSGAFCPSCYGLLAVRKRVTKNLCQK